MSIWSSEVDEFLGNALASGLAQHAALREALVEFDFSNRDHSTLNRLCAHLVGKGVLTKWQSDKLREGKYKGFYIDNYRLQDHLGVDGESSTYLALDVHEGGHYSLTVTPGASSRTGHLEFEARRLTVDQSDDADVGASGLFG